MKFSINAIRFLNQHYGSAGDPAADGAEALVARVGAQLGGVEETVAFGDRFKDVVIAGVVTCRKHENSDHLNICLIDDGGKVGNVERDPNGYVQVVCGAPNVRKGLTVAWLPPGATVPESLIKGEPFVIEARDIRGERSNGMLASARELTIGDNHDGILEITTDDDENSLAPGTRLADAGHLDGDVIIDIENKMFTHRPDCFGWLGIAREIEGIYGRPYKSPGWYSLDAQPPETEKAEPLPLHVRNELPGLVPRFLALTMRDVRVGPSPLWLQLDLARAGIRPINNIVDYTNFFMLETGQPLHAYDYDKVRALDAQDNPAQAEPDQTTNDARYATLVVRYPQAGEKIKLLNGKEIEPRSEAIMIATDKRLVGIGGVMGGSETEVDEHTRNIILECATFDMYSIRKTSMAHGLFTDAVTRFSKGQSPLQNRAVICKIADEIARFAGGKVTGLWDDNHLSGEIMERGALHPPVQVTPAFINARLGLSLSGGDMRKLLENVEFKVDNVAPPKRVILLHGRNKTPQDAWYPWFKTTCEEKGVSCEAPVLPNANAPVLHEWLDMLEGLRPDADTVLVGHSRGGMAILRWLEQAPESVRVKKVVLVAVNNPAFKDGAADDFYAKPGYDFEKIRSHCDEFVLFHSHDDDFVPFAAGQSNAAGLHGRLRAYDGLQHFGNNLARMQAIIDETLCSDGLVITAPFWRTDIEIREDVVEEIGRLYGYDHLPLDLPKRPLAPAAQNAMLALKKRIRAQLAKSGASEVLTYSFVHGNLLDKVGQSREQAFRLSNALSPDLQYLRLSLLPSLLDKVHANIKAGHEAFALFEMGTSHNISDTDETGLPAEHARLALVYAANDKFAKAEHAGASYYQARTYAEELLHGLGLHNCTFAEYRQVDGGAGSMPSWQAPFASGRTAVVMATINDHPNTIVGFVGEFRRPVNADLKLPAFCAGFEFDLNVLLSLHAAHQIADDYTRLPAFPKIEQDICLRVEAAVPYQALYDFAGSALAATHIPNTVHSLRPIDIYQRDGDAEHKQITFRLSIASYEKTLRDQEVAKLLDDMAEAAHQKFGAERI